MDVLAGIVTSMRKTGIFPVEHKRAVAEVMFLDDPHIHSWIRKFGSLFPQYFSYLIFLNELKQRVERLGMQV